MYAYNTTYDVSAPFIPNKPAYQAIILLIDLSIDPSQTNISISTSFLCFRSFTDTTTLKPALSTIMDPIYRPDLIGSTPQDHYTTANTSNDQSMGGVDDNLSTTPTGSYSNGQQPRHQTTQSADFPNSQGTFSQQQETERYPSPNMAYTQQPMQSISRPSSGLSGSGDRYGSYSQTYQDQNQRPSQQSSEASKTQSSVVIKVGMVGDAQIGKTSLMVKYVEGSWDEDYIQTLGRFFPGVEMNVY